MLSAAGVVGPLAPSAIIYKVDLYICSEKKTKFKL